MVTSGDAMKKNGFTLIEVIAVVLLIGLLSIFVLPAVINQIGNKTETINDVTKNMIYSATKLYIEQNEMEITGKDCTITLQKVIDAGLLDKSAATYASGTEIPTNRIIEVTKNAYNQYEYEIVKTCK